MDLPKPPPPPTPADLARQAEERRVADAVRLRRWRARRLHYAVVTIAVGLVLPATSLLVAGGVAAGGVVTWITHGGWVPLLLTGLGGALAAALVFVRGWGVSLGMITFGALFILLVVVTRATLGALLPAMPGLVALFVAAGGAVGYLTLLEEGD